MDLIKSIQDMLLIQGVTTEYTDEQIQMVVNQALTLCELPIESKDELDYERDFCSDIYITENYPIMDNSTVSCMLNDDIIIPSKITSDGIIYFKDIVEGRLEVSYKVGLPEYDLQYYILPITVALLKQYGGGNLASINEGDVSISFDNTGNTVTNIDSMVNELRNKYGHRVVFI